MPPRADTAKALIAVCAPPGGAVVVEWQWISFGLCGFWLLRGFVIFFWFSYHFGKLKGCP